MNPKPQPNHRQYLEILRAMSPDEKLKKVFEMSAFAKALFLAGLRKRFPEATEEEIRRIYLKRQEKCHNRNW
jgi:hypothetical protein